MSLTIVLASSSVARQKLLASLEIPFTIAIPDIDETPLTDETAEALVQRLAYQKANAVAQQFEQALIIGSDQVCLLNNEPVSKPLTRANAIAQLTAASGKTIWFYTGLCLLNTHSQQHQIAVVNTAVTFRELSYQEIETYVDKEKPLHCAGGFHAEGLGMTLFEKWQSDDPSALIGLPLITLITMLRQQEITVLDLVQGC
jgi:septum formation protein